MFKLSMILCFLLLGCNSLENNTTLYKAAQKGKYKQSECGLKVQLKWKKENYYDSYITKVTDEFYDIFRNFSSPYYIASFGVIHENKEIKFIFHNYCEKKDVMLKEYMEKYLSKVTNFPKYEIVPYTPSKYEEPNYIGVAKHE